MLPAGLHYRTCHCRFTLCRYQPGGKRRALCNKRFSKIFLAEFSAGDKARRSSHGNRYFPVGGYRYELPLRNRHLYFFPVLFFISVYHLLLCRHVCFSSSGKTGQNLQRAFDSGLHPVHPPSGKNASDSGSPGLWNLVLPSFSRPDLSLFRPCGRTARSSAASCFKILLCTIMRVSQNHQNR